MRKLELRLALVITSLMTLLTTLLAPPRIRRGSGRRGAEFIEVALYAAIILAIALVIGGFLRGSFRNLFADIRDALGANR